MAETTQADTSFTPEKFERVNALLQRLKEEAREAHEANDTFMLSVYNNMLQVCSPIVVKALARLEREEKAKLNKYERTMRKAERVARETVKNKAS